jgi:hypothetical protein
VSLLSFDVENGCPVSPQNVGKLLPDYMASHPSSPLEINVTATTDLRGRKHGRDWIVIPN